MKEFTAARKYDGRTIRRLALVAVAIRASNVRIGAEDRLAEDEDLVIKMSISAEQGSFLQDFDVQSSDPSKPQAKLV